MIVFLLALCCILGLGVIVLCVMLGDARMSLEEMSWNDKDFRREQRLKTKWRERADGANKQKQLWRRRARFNKALVDHLERNQLELTQQLHWMTLAYERIVDAVYRGRRAGQVIVTDLPRNTEKAPIRLPEVGALS